MSRETLYLKRKPAARARFPLLPMGDHPSRHCQSIQRCLGCPMESTGGTTMHAHPPRRRQLAFLIVAAACSSSLQAQNAKPPKAQLWMDLSTGSMAGMPEMEMPAGMGGAIAGMMMGGGARGGASTSYGLARGMGVMPPRVLDVAFHNSLRPGAEAAQAIPPAMRMGESLPLLRPPRREAPAGEREPGEPPSDVQQPKGRILVYWGCGETVRPGQPRVIDLARGSPSEFATAFAGRHAPDRGARIGANHVLYPNERNTVMLARDSSLVGEHQVRGDGVPPSMKFTLGEAQNVMPAIQLQTRGTVQDSMAISWAPVPHARAYYLHAMSGSGNDMILWSSAETPDTGMGLFDYLPNATIEQWTRQRVLLRPDTTSCAVPRGIFAPAAGAREEATPMLRMIAYGGESNFAHPPRPSDPKVVWEPEWTVRVRVKSHTMAMLGQEQGGAGTMGQPSQRRGEETAAPAAGTEQDKPGPLPGLPVNPGAILRGIFGR
jgi:hypothetical protein